MLLRLVDLQDTQPVVRVDFQRRLVAVEILGRHEVLGQGLVPRAAERHLVLATDQAVAGRVAGDGTELAGGDVDHGGAGGGVFRIRRRRKGIEGQLDFRGRNP